MNTIICEYTKNDDINVYGAENKEQAREAALAFFRADCDEEGLTLDSGFLSLWGYPDEAPDVDWRDHYYFMVIDTEPLPREYYEY